MPDASEISICVKCREHSELLSICCNSLYIISSIANAQQCTVCIYIIAAWLKCELKALVNLRYLVSHALPCRENKTWVLKYVR